MPNIGPIIEHADDIKTLANDLKDGLFDSFHAEITFEVNNGSNTKTGPKGIETGLYVTDIIKTSSDTAWVTKDPDSSHPRVMRLPFSNEVIPDGDGFLSAARNASALTGAYVSFVVSLGTFWVNVTDAATFNKYAAVYPQPDIPKAVKAAISNLQFPLAVFPYFLLSAVNPWSGAPAALDKTFDLGFGHWDNRIQRPLLTSLNGINYQVLDDDYDKYSKLQWDFKFGIDEPHSAVVGHKSAKHIGQVLDGHVEGPHSKSNGRGFWDANGNPCLPHVSMAKSRPANDNNEVLLDVQVSNVFD